MERAEAEMKYELAMAAAFAAFMDGTATADDYGRVYRAALADLVRATQPTTKPRK